MPHRRIVRADIVRRLRAIRAELGLSVAQLAAAIGTNRTAYHNWESDTTPHFPAEEAMARLTEVMPGLTLDYIYLGKMAHMPSGLAIRLTAREQGLSPGAPGAAAQAGAVVAVRVAQEQSA